MNAFDHDCCKQREHIARGTFLISSPLKIPPFCEVLHFFSPTTAGAVLLLQGHPSRCSAVTVFFLREKMNEMLKTDYDVSH